MTAGTGALPDAVVFDCDGTLADTERLSQRIWTEALAEVGVTPTPEDFAAVIGHAWPASFERFSRRGDLGDPATFRLRVRAVAERVHASEMALFEDAVTTLLALHDAGVPIAVASSSSAAHVRRCLDHGGLTDRVGAIVGVDDVRHPKPHPEPYLRAARALGVPPAATTAVEDTVTGLTSARAAGMRTVAVARGAVDAAGLTIADRVVARLDLELLRLPATAVRTRADRGTPGVTDTTTDRRELP